MRTLLVPMTDPKGQDSVLKVAFSLVRTFSAHLTCLFIRPDPRAAIPFMGEGLTADAIQDLVDASDREGKARAARTYAVFEETRKKQDIPLGDGLGPEKTATVAWEESTGFIADRVGRAARLADLTVVPQPIDPNSEDSADLLNEVLFRSGRPLLLAPPNPSETIGSTILVAWNGRAECARTVAAALPFLHRAERIFLLTVGEEHPDRPSLEGLNLYLARQGISADILHRESDDKSVGETIRDTAETLGADLLVMGAFSHSRWREMIIGGVTRHAIHHAKIPVFMSH
ncbi:universal stress protein UspA [Iodidimonas muriae]|uniref:Universal stress protein UspA n=1 Tax=Iodidimonas muriae TaxID=261467 RepID=A0ABQ2LAI9_9PROT|nr:universal stress protein [Iodidimonas muriae]GER06216.1 universal stress protein UspA [Kordiimonadales bacterium JCM 17843]GGO08682.1 universal stress protein UspA [Iodidimonas muriae]